MNTNVTSVTTAATAATAAASAPSTSVGRVPPRAPVAPPASHEAAPTTRAVPAARVLESEADYLLVLDVPGVDESGVALTVELDPRGGRVLRLRAQRGRAVRAGAKLLSGKEPAAELERVFRLSDGVDTDAIEAEVSHGVVRIRVPKAERARPRAIPVRKS
jgi:HSP20 family molecular chaperone IbpA